METAPRVTAPICVNDKCAHARSKLCDFELCKPCCKALKIGKGEQCKQHSPGQRKALGEKQGLIEEESQEKVSIATEA